MRPDLAEPILALVCGYADWERRRLSMLVAHVDESGKGDKKVFVVGCLTAMPGQWLKFTQEWKAALPPGVKNFKYSKAIRKPWFEATLPKLLEVINQNVERADLLAIHVPVYEALFKGKVSVTYDNPFHQGYVAIMAQCLAELSKGASHKVDFVFDRMTDTEFVEVLRAWRQMKRVPPHKHVKKIIGSAPILRDDAVVVPLQGADLIAGLMWRACHGKGTAPSHIDGLKIKHRAMAWDETTLPQLINGIERTKFQNGIFYEDAERRSIRLAKPKASLRASRK